MGVIQAGKRYRKWLKKIFGKEIPRRQLNFPCDRNLILILKIMAKRLECPIFCVAEHCLQLGLGELATITTDDALKSQLSRHLIQNHLLLPAPKPEPALTRQVARIKNALVLVELFETAKNPEEISNILKRVTADVIEGEENANE